MHHAEIISTLGGIQAVARALGCSQSSVCRWRQDGIPAARWPALARLGVSFDALLSGSSDRSPAPMLRRGPKPRVAA